ncbi:hypothetical protein SEA_NAPOLEONB_62 [Arthrobacter phage NapoleonB]|uniref:Uncharacterized protein n=1 Tax=Arthrobacter phage Dynamite TaxID=2867479 RepID=A0AAE9BRC7_9CAUD|nr:hypothetical protein PQB82_gp62 [Arthrobacter phage Dynamite]QFP95030.1 hypothetical protein SEA_NAPOLEONB_62 [Arthrobacter phage NapoleonB]UAW09223.1 hypothetical protein SEA_DYNAMITE_62 [Arthrobacter phage Dynamite]
MSYSSENPTQMECAEETCDATHDSSFAYAVITAGKEGWFMQKNGDNWCPKHTPEWVAAWRERKARYGS